MSFCHLCCRTSHPLLHTSHQRTRKTNKLTQNFSTTSLLSFFPFWQNSGAQSIALRSRAFPRGTLLSGALGVDLCRARAGIWAAWVTCGALRVCCVPSSLCTALLPLGVLFIWDCFPQLCFLLIPKLYLFRVSICSKLLINMIMTWK